MKNILFIIGELISNLDKNLAEEKELTNYLSFSRIVIDSTSFEIIYSSKRDKVILSLSTHPLDIPWNIQVRIFIDSIERKSLNDWKTESSDNVQRVTYGVTPTTLVSHENDNLAGLIAQDLISYYKEL